MITDNKSEKINMIKVASAAGVSIATISRVVNGHGNVSEKTRNHVLEVLKELNYRPNRLARSLITKRSCIIALIIDDISNPFYPQIALGVETAAKNAGYSLILCNLNGSAETEIDYINVLLGRQVDGLIFVASRVDSSFYTTKLQIDVPVVSMDRQINIPGADQVFLENVAGGYKITKYLIDRGHTRIAHITGPLSMCTASDRKQGYHKALEEARITSHKHLIVEADYKLLGGQLATEKILKAKILPTAIFYANDLMAIGGMDAIRRANLRTPEDIAVAGYDDISFAALTYPSLTTVQFPTINLGSMAMQMLLDRIQGLSSNEPRDVILEPSVIARNSA
jgi:LacI family transcriptional regulator